MTEPQFLSVLIWAWIILALIIFIVLFFIAAPYGRYSRKGWGATVSDRMGWVVMESISPILFAHCFAAGGLQKTAPLWLFFGLWEVHYLHRAFIYPFSARISEKKMPVLVVISGVFFNFVNAYMNGRYLFSFSEGYSIEWLFDPRFIGGLALFIIGFVINRQSDNILRNLRQPGSSNYHIAETGLFRYVSCPNYFGEILIWIGWAIATWSPAGLSFALWTMANLIPRARAHHGWYKEYFPDYPPERKALIPGLW
jgi:3-oxo-5-alpha-steroid 4-dehydrogenase 1